MHVFKRVYEKGNGIIMFAAVISLLLLLVTACLRRHYLLRRKAVRMRCSKHFPLI